MTQTSKDLSQLPCRSLKGVGKSIADRLARLQIHTVQDLLFHLPLRYQDRTRIHPIASVRPGDHIVIEGELDHVSFPKIGKTRFLGQLRDVTGRINLRFFHLNAQQRSYLSPGTRLRCFGEVRRGPQGLEMVHPEYHAITPGMPLVVEENLTPIYPTTEGLSQLSFRRLTDQALFLLEKEGYLPELIPPALLQEYAFPTLGAAIRYVHRPPADAPVEVLAERNHITQQRLVFEELLAHRLSMLNLKAKSQVHAAPSLSQPKALLQRFMDNLAFALTGAQQRVLEAIQLDLVKPHPMMRLVQGDVGSGKTVVAALAALQAAGNGYQCAILAPTELLAEQHYRVFSHWFQALDIRVALLTGQLKTREKQETLQGVADGSIAIVIGTHALFQKEVSFAKLALMIVDEQHRFGVDQRAKLREKGAFAATYPHQLIMTATPIPRTLAMSVYADLDYSVIDELPPGRTPVTTILVSNTRRDEVFSKIHGACASGRQVYWVCTLIEESEVLQCQAAEQAALDLRLSFPDLKIGLLHGRLKSSEKESIMNAFKAGDIQLLVATTVIEVGVDVPNASLMVVENAERLGLAQLHQLRGRVGRGAVMSHCVLLYQSPLSQLAKSRLAVMRETTDGFVIAERDLTLRGPGEVLGTRQTGDVGLRIADLLKDNALLPTVQSAADTLLKTAPAEVPVLIQRWLGQSIKYGHV